MMLYCPYAFIMWFFINHKNTCTGTFMLCPVEVTCYVKSKVSMTVKIHVLSTYQITKCSNPEGLGMVVFLYLQL
jgi:hypothetical protein